MPKQPAFEMLRAERLLEQGVVAEIDHPCAQVVASLSQCVDHTELIRTKWMFRGLESLFFLLCGSHTDYAPALRERLRQHHCVTLSTIKR